MKGFLFRPDVWKAKLKVLEQYGEAQTRRVSGLKEINKEPDNWRHVRNVVNEQVFIFQQKDGLQKIIKPRYRVGEVVYIKEAHFIGGVKPNEWVIFKDSKLPIPKTKVEDYHWQIPRFMPAWAARYFIQITDVKPQRLQKITEEDCLKEGCPQIQAATGLRIQWYKELWDSINPKYPWTSNLWIWVYTFKKGDRKSRELYWI